MAASNSTGKRYFPKVGDIVLGTIVGKSADSFKVDIHAPFSAVMSNIAFNSASKRHRPNLKLGQPVLCHVISANKHMDIELSCEDPTTQKDWVTNEVYFGALPDGGLVIEVPMSWAIKLMDKSNEVMPIIGQYFKPFELCVGVNGHIYIRASEGEYLRTVLIAETIKKARTMSLLEIEELCREQETRLK